MSIQQLPPSPNLENLKKRAKSLHKAARAEDSEALETVGPYFGDPTKISLQQAQLVIARTYGYSSWAKLKHRVERGETGDQLDPEQLANRFLELVCLVYNYDADPVYFDEARTLLDEHPEIATENIHTAAAIGDVEQLEAWLDRDSSLLEQKGGYHHWSPLMYAAYARLPGASTLAAAQLLIERGADPNTHYMSGGQYKFTALTGAFGQGEAGSIRQPEHPEFKAFARLLLEAGANPNDSQAAYNRCFEPDNTCFELMLEFGLSGKDKNNWSEVIDGTHLPNLSETMHFHLIQAIHRGYVDRAKLLIDHGVDVNKPDDTYDTRTKGKTPFESAMLMGETEIAEYLAANGAADTELSPQDQFEAAVMAGDLEKAKRLSTEESTAIDRNEDREIEMLCSAVGSENHPALKTMIALGFELNGNTHRRRPLHDAAFRADSETIQLLLDAGADPKLRDWQHGTPPIGFALYAKNDAAVELFDRCEMDIFTASTRGKLEQIQARLTEDPARLEMPFSSIKPNPDDASPFDWATPIVYAVLMKQLSAVNFLLERGANPKVSGPDDQNLLDVAREHGSEEVVAAIERALDH